MLTGAGADIEIAAALGTKPAAGVGTDEAHGQTDNEVFQDTFGDVGLFLFQTKDIIQTGIIRQVPPVFRQVFGQDPFVFEGGIDGMDEVFQTPCAGYPDPRLYGACYEKEAANTRQGQADIQAVFRHKKISTHGQRLTGFAETICLRFVCGMPEIS